MRALYHKKLSQGKTEKKTLIYGAKKLPQIMLAILKSGEPYDPMRYSFPPEVDQPLDEIAELSKNSPLKIEYVNALWKTTSKTPSIFSSIPIGFFFSLHF